MAPSIEFKRSVRVLYDCGGQNKFSLQARGNRMLQCGNEITFTVIATIRLSVGVRHK